MSTDGSGALDLTFASRSRGFVVANVKSAPLAGGLGIPMLPVAGRVSPDDLTEQAVVLVEEGELAFLELAKKLVPGNFHQILVLRTWVVREHDANDTYVLALMRVLNSGGLAALGLRPFANGLMIRGDMCHVELPSCRAFESQLGRRCAVHLGRPAQLSAPLPGLNSRVGGEAWPLGRRCPTGTGPGGEAGPVRERLLVASAVHNCHSQALSRLRAFLLRRTTRRDVGRAIAAWVSSCVSVREIVSIVRPR